MTTMSFNQGLNHERRKKMVVILMAQNNTGNMRAAVILLKEECSAVSIGYNAMGLLYEVPNYKEGDALDIPGVIEWR